MPPTSPDAPQATAAADPRLVGAVEVAREAAVAEAGAEDVGDYTGHVVEDDGSVTHFFASELSGYRGWQWSATVATGDADDPVTISEIVLLPGSDALVAPAWVPWTDRVRAGDLGVGDLFPTDPDDPRLVPSFLADEDPGSERLNPELGLGRPRVLSRQARLDLGERWREGERGPDDPMARSAPGTCVGCAFYLPLAGLFSATFGACGNAMSPADSQVVHAEYGCGAHSEVQVDRVPTVPVVELVYDDSELDVHVLARQPEPAPEPEAEAAVAEPEAEAATEVAEPEAEAVEPEAEAVATGVVEPEAEAVATEVAEPEAVAQEAEAVATEAAEPEPETAEPEAEAAEPEAAQPEAAEPEAAAAEAPVASEQPPE